MTDPLESLAAFNREEWADKPFLIELRGGPRNGKRFRWHSLPMMWREAMPPKFDLTDFLSTSALQPLTAAEQFSIADYRETGSVMDDGAHIYEFDRYE